MSDALVTVQKSDTGYAILTLNRPNAMNALSSGLCAQLSQAIDKLEADPEVRVLILTGAGRAFCAGLDLKELGSGSSDGVTSLITGGGDPVKALARFTGPVIGAINGVAITGGFELALACDVLLASSEARFADTHARVGIIPGWGLSQKLSRLLGPSRAKEISFAGNFISAAQAERLGLVNRVVEPSELLEQAKQLATDMLSAVPEILPVYKKLIDDGYALPYGEALRLEDQASKAWSKAVKPEQIAERRAQVQERGRAQQSKK